MTEQLHVAPTICTCGQSSPGIVVVLKGNTEHHCLPPAPCWTDIPLVGTVEWHGKLDWGSERE